MPYLTPQQQEAVAKVITSIVEDRIKSNGLAVLLSHEWAIEQEGRVGTRLKLDLLPILLTRYELAEILTAEGIEVRRP